MWTFEVKLNALSIMILVKTYGGQGMQCDGLNVIDPDNHYQYHIAHKLILMDLMLPWFLFFRVITYILKDKSMKEKVFIVNACLVFAFRLCL